MPSVFPSGGHPPACKNGHPWEPHSGNMLVGSHECTCENARSHFYRHMWIRCLANEGACALIWRDPPCGHLQAP